MAQLFRWLIYDVLSEDNKVFNFGDSADEIYKMLPALYPYDI